MTDTDPASPRTGSLPDAAAASRLAAELMPVSVAVGGHGDADLAAILEEAGIAAETVRPDEAFLEARGDEPGAFDLAILLASPVPATDDAAKALVGAVAYASDRVLFVPRAEPGTVPSLADLTAWFEVFAELGYQPVVDYDAGFLAQGAFLVDRAATAAESELGGFAGRLSLGGALAASTQRVASLEAELAGGEQALQAKLAAREADLAALRTELAAALVAARQAAQRTADAEAGVARAEAELAAQNAGWEALRGWVRAAVAKASTNAPKSRLEPGSRIEPRSGPKSGPKSLQNAVRRLFGRLSFTTRLFARPLFPSRGGKAEMLRQQQLAMLRASPLFDAAWYVASNPELAADAADPVLHYLAIGAAKGCDPGPWFDTAAYLREHPDVAASGENPLLHAIRTEAAHT